MPLSDARLVGLAGAARVMRDSASSPSPTPSPILGTPEVDGDKCKLMGPFALFVQAIMGILVIGSLVYKRQREKPKRRWKIWALDVSKQMLGQLFVHILNVVLSDFVASGGGENPCSLYFLNILVDTTLGVFFIYVALKYVTWFLTERLGLEGFVSGQYAPPPLPTPLSSASARAATVSDSSSAGPAARRSLARAKPRLEYWLKQLASYLFVLLLMKMAVLVVLAIFPFLFDVGSWILGFFGSHKDAQVLFSMALFPLAMNVLQFWLIDSLLRHNPYTSAYSKINPDDEAFLNTSDRISQDSHFSESALDHSAQPHHAIGRDSDEDEDAQASAKSRRRPSPQRAATSDADRPYDLRPNRPIDEMRRQASLTLSDPDADADDNMTASIHQAMSSSKASIQRPESHHLKQVSDERNR
ncbi:hypothetical protein L1887_57719 [Cichorium endivia]|nr:hypothetical protein L1887_57719 [Cichorium endivia]